MNSAIELNNTIVFEKEKKSLVGEVVRILKGNKYQVKLERDGSIEIVEHSKIVVVL